MDKRTKANGIYGGVLNGMFKNIPPLLDPTGKIDYIALIKLVACIVVAAVFVGTEVVKILFRNGYTIDTRLDSTKFVLAALSFLGIGWVTLTDEEPRWVLHGQLADVVSIILGILFIALGLFIFINGWRHRKKTKNGKLPYSSGKSYLLKFLVKKEKTERIVQDLLEPLCVLFASGIFYIFNPLPGITLLVCAIGYWINSAIEYLFGGDDSLSERVDGLNTPVIPIKTVHRIKD